MRPHSDTSPLRFPTSRPAGGARAGFTLIELLTVVAILGVLAAILVPTIAACRRQADKSREVSAARQMMTAFQMAADERKGVYLSLLANGNDSRNEAGDVVSNNPAAKRWPHHLRPYLGNRFKAVLYVNEQADFYDEVVGGSMADYHLTMGPSFGMNGLFVGAVASNNIDDRPVRRLEDAALPSQLIAFASANGRASFPTISARLGAGYFKIESPAIGWPTEDLSERPADTTLDAAYGYVSYRLGGKAAVVFLDGHVELQTCARLRDMRLWSDQARRRDDPDYRPGF